MEHQIVAKLLNYAHNHLYLEDSDMLYMQNKLLGILNLETYEGPSVFDLIKDDSIHLDLLIDELREYIVTHQLVEENAVERLIDQVFGLLTPYPSVVEKQFEKLANHDISAACAYLYNLQIANNYIQMRAVKKNIIWEDNQKPNKIVITINLSKPEKNNQEIAKLKSMASSSHEKYPKCLLCLENLGYQGRINHPSRCTLRTIPLKLKNRAYFLQYSPYVYYHEHCIIIDNVHRDMEMNIDKIERMLEFVDLFPQYFIGSNSELPIVGGSILNHEHFQGGRFKMPVMFAKPRYLFSDPRRPHLQISYLDWYNSVIKIKGKNKNDLLQGAQDILLAFKNYDDKEIGIICQDEKGEHSTITPIAAKDNEEYCLYLILRNNRCDDEHKEGIFHAHQEHHHIKKEGIGLIEAMGYFILPPRLYAVTEHLTQLLIGKMTYKEILDIYPDLEKYKTMIDELVQEVTLPLSNAQSEEVIKNKIGDTCYAILENTAVFKNDKQGNHHLCKFMMDALGYKML